jgi:hypothetical protein
MHLLRLLVIPLALLAAEPPTSDDAAWLKDKGKLLFADTFDRDETGNGHKAIGNGWESATADRVPQIKQADLDEGILKVSSATKEAGHAVHIHHDAGFADGGVTLRFRFPGLNKGESLQLGFVDRSLPDVHAGHLGYAILSATQLTLKDSMTGEMNLAIRKQREEAAAAKTKVPAELEALLKTKQLSVPFKTDNEWHALTLVTEGDEMRCSLDGKLVSRHRSPGFAHPMKRWFSFLAPSTVWIDDVKIYQIK